MSGRRYQISLLVFILISNSFVAFTHEMLSWPREGKFPISKQPWFCINYFVYFCKHLINKRKQTLNSLFKNWTCFCSFIALNCRVSDMSAVAWSAISNTCEKLVGCPVDNDISQDLKFSWHVDLTCNRQQIFG